MLKIVARRLAIAALVAALLLVPRTASVEAAPALDGDVTGFELCPQVICGAAVFAGAFAGALDGVDGTGGWWVAVNHADLPTPGENAAITGGRWSLRVGDRRLNGLVDSGTIRNNGDGTFTVMPRLASSGSDGMLTLDVTLDHRTFPPAVTGRLDAGDGNARDAFVRAIAR